MTHRQLSKQGVFVYGDGMVVSITNINFVRDGDGDLFGRTGIRHGNFLSVSCGKGDDTLGLSWHGVMFPVR